MAPRITLANQTEGWRAALTRTTAAAVAAVAAAGPATIVRMYKGKQADANAAFQQDAAALAGQGYVPTSQSWAPGQWGRGAFMLAVFLFLFLIGILVFIYMLLFKPDGTLTVTYTRQQLASSSQMPPAARPTPVLVDRLSQLDQAKASGLVTDEEYAARRAKILDDA